MTKTTTITLLLLCFAFQAFASDDLPNLITVVGKGDIKYRPDKVVVQLGIYLRNNDLNVVREEVDQRSSELIAYLKDQGIASSDIQTSYVTLQPVYSYDPTGYQNTVPDYYSASKTLTFTLRKISRYDDIMEGVYDIGVNSVNGVDFRVNNEDSKRLQARRVAVQNAKDIAKVLAEELDVEVGKVFSVTDQPTNYGYPIPLVYEAASYAADSVGASAGPSIAGGVVRIDASVEVKFYIDYDKYYEKDVVKDYAAPVDTEDYEEDDEKEEADEDDSKKYVEDDPEPKEEADEDVEDYEGDYTKNYEPDHEKDYETDDSKYHEADYAKNYQPDNAN